MKLSAISYLLHIILQTYGYVDIDDGGDEMNEGGETAVGLSARMARWVAGGPKP